MKKAQNFLAVDFGGGSGRGILGSFDGEHLSLQEIHRFPDRFVNIRNQLYWDSLRMYDELLSSIMQAQNSVGSGELKSVGIDCWGTDYGLIDGNGQPIGGVRCVRNSSDLGMRLAREQMPDEEIYLRTGCEMTSFATLCLLLERQVVNDPALASAKRLLLLPDYFAYFLTGEKMAEYTNSTTTMLFSVKEGVWDYDLMDRYGLCRDLVGHVTDPASVMIPISRDVAKPLRAEGLCYVPVATHDTASAVTGAPLKDAELFISSGTCSLIGVILDEPVLTKEACRAHFTNEGTIDGHFRFLHNVVGMWVLQQCMSEWKAAGQDLTWDALVAAAKRETPFCSLINLQEPPFFNEGHMIEKIQKYCRMSGQIIPETPGAIARCVYESLALTYRMTWDQIRDLTGKNLTAVRVFGGGCRNRLLNQMTADAIGVPVCAGPAEASSIGNLLVQAMAFHEVADQKELREIVDRSFETEVFEPDTDNSWEVAVERYRELKNMDEKKETKFYEEIYIG